MADESSHSPLLVPIVRWAQNKDVITLKIELMECKTPKLQLEPESITFEALGVGAKGENLYGFSLDFWSGVMAESVVHKVSGSYVEVFLSKGKSGWWPHLTKVAKSPHFLKLDFEKWMSESDDEEERQKKDTDEIMEEILKQKEVYEQDIVKLKTSYLMIYNVMQWVLHMYIFMFCAISIYQDGSTAFTYIYGYCGKSVQVAVAFSWIEVVNTYGGITKGSWVTPCMQCFGRSFAMFCLWLTADSIMYDWYVTILFMAWSAVEVIRYPLYICQLTNMKAKILTWLRYTVWIPLYPIGTAMEVMIYINAMNVITSNNLYELQLPNSLNVILKFSWLLMVQIAGLIYTVAFILMPHMWKQRRIRLGGKRKYKQP